MEARVSYAINKDCMELIQKFSKSSGPTFQHFCENWKQMNFHHIYTTQLTEVDMICTTRRIFAFCKTLFIKTRNLYEKVGVIYLLYIIYFKQPQKHYEKIQVDLKTWIALSEFIDSFNMNKDMDQVRYIFFYLINRNAFRYVVSDIYYGLEPLFNKSQDYAEPIPNDEITENIISPELTTLIHESEGFLTAFSKLQNDYNNKKKILNSKETISSKKIDMTNIVGGFEKELNEISTLLSSKNDSNDNVDKNDDGNCKSIKNRRSKIRKKAYAANEKSTKNFTCNIMKKIHFSEDSQESPEKKTDTKKETMSCTRQDKCSETVNSEIRKKKVSDLSKILNEPLPGDVLKELEEPSSSSIPSQE